MPAIASGQKQPLRPLDSNRDLPAVADLIEECFLINMDPDGLEYLRQIRMAAEDSSRWGWLHGVAQNTGTPLTGYVWEEDGRVVGNLTLIPHHRSGRIIYTIANVGVLPNYRRRGIGGELTRQGIEHARRHHASAVWLQVRADNLPAYEMYLGLGFTERARRTTWESTDPYPTGLKIPAGVRIKKRLQGDWDQQFAWLGRVYPSEVIWNIPLNRQRLRPGFWQAVERLLSGAEIRHWTAVQHGERIGILTWEPTRLHADHLWLAAPVEEQAAAVLSLLPAARYDLGFSRTLQLNYPAGQAEDAFRAAGFIPQTTLAWMKISFEQNKEDLCENSSSR